MFVSDKNVAYIHVVYSCSMLDKVEEEHALSIFMCYGMVI